LAEVGGETNWGMMVIDIGFTLWSFNIAMENGSFVVDLPIKHGDFP